MKDYNKTEEKNLNIKSNIKKTILGLALGSFIVSLTPNIKYKIALYRAKNNGQIINLVNDKDNREKNLKKLYEKAIYNNANIPYEDKDILINAFEDNFIEPYYDIILDEAIYNMYAVASTQKIKRMSEFSKKYGWWVGDYNSYTNTIYLCDYELDALTAHEQLHAILKKDLFDNGYTKGLSGIGLNEALTVSFIKDDETYKEQYLVSDYLGLIIGYDKLYQYYFSGDLDGLKNELNEYIPKEETNKLIYNMDMQVYSDYALIFLNENDISTDILKKEEAKGKITRYKKCLEDENTKILKDLFENKYNCKVEESNLGRIIFGKGNDLFDEDRKEIDPMYEINYYDPNHVKIFVKKSNCTFLEQKPNYFRTYFIRNEELENFDIDTALKLAINNGKHY